MKLPNYQQRIAEIQKAEILENQSCGIGLVSYDESGGHFNIYTRKDTTGCRLEILSADSLHELLCNLESFQEDVKEIYTLLKSLESSKEKKDQT